MRKIGVASLLLILSFNFYSIVLGEQNKSIHTQGTISYPNSNLIHGISMPTGSKFGYADYSHPVYSDVDYQRIIDWGLNAVAFVVFWTNEARLGGIEPYEDQPGVYNEIVLEELDYQIELAQSYGLQVFICSRVSLRQDGSVGWADIYGADYVNLNKQDSSGSYGRERYIKLLKMLAQRDPDVGRDPWLVPYHNEVARAIEPDIVSTFYTVTQPALYNAIRSVSSAPIVLNGIIQGVAKNDQGWYTGTGQLNNQPIYSDPNIFYGINTHDGAPDYLYGHIIKGSDWNYDYASLEEYYRPAVEFKERNPETKLITMENLALDIHNLASERPIKQSRLDWMRASLEIQEEIGINWFYWRYEVTPEVQAPYEPDGTYTAVAELLKEYG
ncbi:MAG: hypothetical protein ACFFDN_04325 [Candidatus Hodarchaeota archaeon]